MPGPVDNRSFKKYLMKVQKSVNEIEDSDFYEISKPLFYYFISSFGGGPAITTNENIIKDIQPLQIQDFYNYSNYEVEDDNGSVKSGMTNHTSLNKS